MTAIDEALDVFDGVDHLLSDTGVQYVVTEVSGVLGGSNPCISSPNVGMELVRLTDFGATEVYGIYSLKCVELSEEPTMVRLRDGTHYEYVQWDCPWRWSPDREAHFEEFEPWELEYEEWRH